MQILTSLPNFSPNSPSYVLTIGNFDGVHLGHKSVLSQVINRASQTLSLSAALTFSNHPANIIRPESPIPLLCTIEHKIELLKQEAIDLLIFIPFTQDLANQSAETFLSHVKKALPFQTLILGNDATLGKNREGDQKKIEIISKKLDFNIEYLSDYSINGIRVSSSKIREYIAQGNFARAEQMLGRPFSIYAPIAKGAGRGSQIGFPTANIGVDNLCLPPLGVYAVTLKHLEKEFLGVANLGMAPTLRSNHKIILEVHLFDQIFNLYGESVEVFFNKYIRPEKKFDNLELLKAQIQKDIQTAKRIHGVDGDFLQYFPR